MKKTFIILIGLLTVVSIFATASKVTSSVADISSTKVKLSLKDDYATVWFSKGANTTAIPEYALSLKNPESLKQNTSGNDSANKIYAGSNDSSTNGLFLNWNIISDSDVLITLKIKTPLLQKGAINVNQKIGWKVSWKYTASNDSTEYEKSISLADNLTDYVAVSDSFYLKNGSIYGEGNSKQIKIETDNVWDKDKTKDYSAVLYAEIKTT